jgi:trigger factor
LRRTISKLSNPEVEITKFVPFTELEFKAKVDVMPSVKLGDYKKIKKSVNKVSVTEKEILEVIDNLLGKSSKKQAVERKAKNGDEVIIDFEGNNEKGEKVAGASGKDYPLVLGSNSFIPGFEEGLAGLKKGDKKDVKLTFPKEYHAKQLAGTKITFAVEVKEVNEVVLPSADDKFAASLGPFETLADLKKDIKTQLTEQKLSEEQNKVKDSIVEELVKRSSFEMPEVLITDQIAMLEHDFNQNLAYRGITMPEYLKQEGFKDADDWKAKQLKPQAERRVSVGIILAEVADKEGLKVDEAEVSARISQYKTQYSSQAAEFDNPEMQREVVSRLLTEKTVDRLFELSTKK